MPNNIIFYPYSTPIILTDALFLQYGGLTGTSTVADRQVAYFLSEQAVSTYIDTLLVNTRVTGTYQLRVNRPVVLDYTYVWGIAGVTIWSRDRNSSCTMTSTSSCAYLRDGQYGIVDVRLVGSCGCSSFYDPYQIEIAFDAGLPSGTAWSPTTLRALAVQAQIELNELEVISQNEGPGDVGITEYRNQEYMEKRAEVIRTSLGNSPLSAYVARLLRPLVRHRGGGL